MHCRVVAGFSTPAPEWASALAARVRRWQAGSRGLRLMNVGDSIATGRWGIASPADHAIARAAGLLAAERSGARRAAPAAAEPDPARIGPFGAPGIRLAPAAGSGEVDWYTSGVGGGRIRDLERHLRQGCGRGYDEYAEAAPDLLTVWIGVNDSIHADEEPLDESARALRRIVAGLTVRGLRVALIAPNPVRSSHQPGPWLVEQSAAAMFEPVVHEFGLPMLDLVTRWGDYDRAFDAGLLRDQVHPTARGHADVGRAIAELVSRGMDG